MTAPSFNLDAFAGLIGQGDNGTGSGSQGPTLADTENAMVFLRKLATAGTAKTSTNVDDLFMKFFGGSVLGTNAAQTLHASLKALGLAQ